MKTRHLALKLATEPPAGPPSLATATGPVFQMLDPPGVVDAHGDTMDAGALTLPPGVTAIPLYWIHSYSPDVVPDARPEQRLPVGTATVWHEGWQWYFTPNFNRLTDLAVDAEQSVANGEVQACSIGYLTVDATSNGQGPDGQGEDVHSAKLLEVSLVDIGAKAGAVRVKAMADKDTKKPEGQQPSMDEQWKALTTDAASMKNDMASLKSVVMTLATQVGALHGKAFPPPEPEKKPDAPPEQKAAPPKQPEEPTDPVAKWFHGKGFTLAG